LIVDVEMKALLINIHTHKSIYSAVCISSEATESPEKYYR